MLSNANKFPQKYIQYNDVDCKNSTMKKGDEFAYEKKGAYDQGEG